MIRRGYTIIEILIVLAILGLLFGVGYVNYRDYARRQAVVSAMRTLRADLKLAAEQAIAGKKPSGCTGDMSGVKFTVTSTSTYQISASCTGGDVVLKQESLPTGMTMNIPSPNPLLFKVIGNGTNLASGSSMVIGITQNFTNNFRSVVVSSSGDIKESTQTPGPTLSPTPSASPSPSPTATPGPPTWKYLGRYGGFCNSIVSIGPVTARQFSITMVNGGGTDRTISFNCYGSTGAAWSFAGVWRGVTNTACPMTIGQTRQTAVYASTQVSQQRISVGCNDGETATFDVSYYGP